MDDEFEPKRLKFIRRKHSYSLLTDHMVFTPKFRDSVIIGEIQEYAEKVIRDICDDLGVELLQIAINPDHVHLFIKYPPRYSVSYIAKIIKGRSSWLIRKRFPHLKKWCKGCLWTPACFHGSVGTGWEVVEKYIRAQRDCTVSGRAKALREVYDEDS